MNGFATNLICYKKARYMLVTWWLSLFVLLTLFVPTSGKADSSSNTVSQKVEEAVLSENWSRVGNLLEHINSETPSPVLRILKAHADLAGNRNNASLSLFVQLTFDDLKTWHTWSEDLASRHETNSASHYLLGDALARARKLQQAHAHFSKAIAANGANYLAWNARGVTSALRGRFDDSLEDFTSALEVRSDFLDTMNNLGMMRIGQGQGRKGAIRRFTATIKSGPSFALAYHGLGCIELLSAQTLAPQDNSNIQKARELAPDTQHLFSLNTGIYAGAFLDKQGQIVLADSGEEGAFIDKSWEHKESRIRGAMSQLNQAQSFYDSNKLNPFIRGHAKRELDFRKQNLGEMVSQTSQADINKMDNGLRSQVASKYSNLSESVGDIGSQAARGQKFTQRQAVVLDTAAYATGVAAAKTKDPRMGAAAVSFKGVKSTIDNLGIEQGYKSTHIQASDMQRRFKNTSDMWSPKVNSHGDRINRSSSPGGAKIDSKQVVWDDHEWPFLPIFGLLYFAADDSRAEKGGES